MISCRFATATMSAAALRRLAAASGSITDSLPQLVADQNVVDLYDARGTRYAMLRLMNRLAVREQARAA
jgi:hypothetical protein